MGAICGIVIPGNSDLAMTKGAKLLEGLKIYTFDKIAHAAAPNMYMGCGVSYHTPESLLENLPRTNKEQTYLLTADAIIDNRTELLETFLIDSSEWPSITDSELILFAYERWGYECPKHLIGDYAFAIWDVEKQELYFARDAVGTRTFYYTSTDKGFGFCTIEKPLLGVLQEKVELNEKWIADFLAIKGVQHEIEHEETVYKGIYQLPAAFYGIWNTSGLTTKQYWDPLQEPAITYETDEEYVAEFNRIFLEAVNCRLRSAGEIGMMLSGGMDSGSIASVAAEELALHNRRLHAYCSVPSKNFHEKPAHKKAIYNETAEVQLITNNHPNIAIQFCSFEEKNALTDVDSLIGVFEQPYKIFQNMTWYNSILQLARSESCTVMLNGQMGNGTISYGTFHVHLLTLFRTRKFISFFKEIKGLSRLLNKPMRKVMRLAFNVVLPYRLRAWRDRNKYKDYDRFEDVPINRSLIAKWNLNERLDSINANLLTVPYHDFEEERRMRIRPSIFSHIGAVETKLSLANKLAIRDPSRDRRIISYCLAIPSNQFVREGKERYLLSRAMKGILPDSIRSNISSRGIQGADWVHRLIPDMDKLEIELDQVLAEGEINRYIDVEKVKQLRAKWAEDRIAKKEEATLNALITVIIFARFMKDFNKAYAHLEPISRLYA